ncbi:ABC transporter C family member 9 [Gossypium australe]|uniref:ABC transporter C family member 9 n=1 Tax=Gossypium australe TaxID=47621 RepID=A0A5B6W0H2_9ROSI|nr:ABC transporter C family member 9 [Gossypium australe]
MGISKKKGYVRSENEPTLYVKKEGNDFIIVCLYVDDIIYTSSSTFLVDEFKSQMINEFEMLDMGLLHYFLGLKVHQAEYGIFISQRKYANDLRSKFGMLNCKFATTPMNINEKLQQEDKGEMADAKRFRSLVGTLEYGVWYSKTLNFKLCGFTDSDWAISLDDGRSVSANVCTLGSGVITWNLKKKLQQHCQL